MGHERVRHSSLLGVVRTGAFVAVMPALGQARSVRRARPDLEAWPWSLDSGSLTIAGAIRCATARAAESVPCTCDDDGRRPRAVREG